MSNWGANDPVIDQPAQSSWGQSDPEVPVELARKHEEQAQMLTHARNRLSGKTKNVASDALLGGTLGVASLIPGVRENALATAVGLGTSVAAPAARNWYQEDLADKLNRFGDAYEQAASERDQKGVIPPILKRAVRGAGKTLPTSIVAGHLAGPYGAIGVTALQERDKAITEGRDMGMSEPQVQRYAAVQGVVEALPAAVFQKIGLGGFESAITRQTASRSVLPAVKQALKDSFQELPEENITELGHSVTRAVMAGDWKAISPKELWNTIKETTVQTLVTMGMVEAPNVAQAGVAGAARAQRLAQLKELRGVNGSVLKREAEKAGINTEGLSRQDVRGQIELEIKREQEIQNEVPPEATQPEEVRQADVGQGQVPAVEVPVGGTTGAPQGNQQAGAEGIPQVPIDEDIMAKILADAEEAGQKASKRQSFADLNSPNPLPETDLQQQATPKGGDVLVQGPTDITIPSAKPKIKGKKPVPTPPESLPAAPQQELTSEPTKAVPVTPVASQEKNKGIKDQGRPEVMLGAGETTTTSSGRQTSPFPKVDTSSNQKAGNTVKRVDKWLHENAVEEARSRGDDFNLRQFEAENPARLPPATVESMNEYLFGEQPKVVPSILKDLIPETQKNKGLKEKPPEPAAIPEATKDYDFENTFPTPTEAAQRELIAGQHYPVPDADDNESGEAPWFSEAAKEYRGHLTAAEQSLAEAEVVRTTGKRTGGKKPVRKPEVEIKTLEDNAAESKSVAEGLVGEIGNIYGDQAAERFQQWATKQSVPPVQPKEPVAKAEDELASLYAQSEKMYSEVEKLQDAGKKQEANALIREAEKLSPRIKELQAPITKAKQDAEVAETDRRNKEYNAKEDARKAALPTKQTRNGWEVASDGARWYLRDPHTKEIVYDGKLARVREVADESPPDKPTSPEPLPPVEEKKAAEAVQEEPDEAPHTGEVSYSEQSKGVNARGVKRTFRATGGNRTLVIEQSKHDGEWSISKPGKYTGKVFKGDAEKTQSKLLASGIVNLRKAKDVAQRILAGTFDPEADQKFVQEDTGDHGKTNAQIGKEIKDNSSRRDAFARLLKEHGIATDGKILMRVDEKDRDSILKGIGEVGEGYDMGRTVQKMLEDAKSAFRISGQAMKPVAYRGGDISQRTVILKSKDGEFSVLDKSYHDTVLKKYPDAVPYWSGEGNKPVVYKDNGEVVALVMPMTGEHDDAHLKSLKEGTYSFGKPAEAAPKIKGKKTKAQQKASQALQEAKDELKSFVNKVGNTLNTGFNPELAAGAGRVVAKWFKAGYYQFQAFIEALKESIGQAQVDKIQPYLESAWDQAYESGEFEGMEPRVAPAKESPANSGETTGSKNAKTNEARARAGMEERPPVEPESVEQWQAEAAKRMKDPNYAPKLAEELAANPKALDPVEQAVMERYQNDLENRRKAGEDVLDEIRTAVEADERVGTIWGRTGVSRQVELTADFTVAGITKQYLRSVNKAPSDAEMQKYSEMADRISALEGELKEKEQKIAQQEVDLQIERAKAAGKAPEPKNKGGKRAQLKQKASDAVAKFKDKWAALYQLGAISNPKEDAKKWAEITTAAVDVVKAYGELGIDSFLELMYRVKSDIGKITSDQKDAFREAWDQYRAASQTEAPETPDNASLGALARRLTRWAVESGITKRDEVIDAVHQELTDMGFEVERSDTMAAMSGYGDFRELSKDEVSVKVRGIKGEIQQLLKLEDMQAGQAPAKTGVERRVPTEEERQLIKKVNEAKKKGGYVVTDPAKQLQSALGTAKTAAKHRITDLENAIAKREKIVAGQTKLAPDAELAALQKKRDELNEEYRKIFPPKKSVFSDAARLKASEKMLDRHIAELKADLAAGNLDSAAKKPGLSSPEIEAKKLQLELLKTAREQAREASPEYQAKEQAKQNARYKASLDRQLALWQERLASGTVPEKRQQTPLDKEMLEKKFQIELVKREVRASVEEAERASRSGVGKALGFGGDLLDLSQAIMTGFEMSAVMRQGAFYTLGHPKQALQAIVNSVRAAVSRRADFAIHDDLMNRPNHVDYMRGGLETTAADGPLSHREELIRSRIASWLSQQKGAAWALPRWAAEGLLGGERAFRSFANTMRADLFDYMKASVEASRPGTWSEDDAKIVGSASNVFSGRGNLPASLAGVASSRILFAPRWVWSRGELLVGRPLWKGDTATRMAVGKVYVRAALGFAGLKLIQHVLYSLLAGDDDDKPEYELDPRATDFNKTKIGDTRIDSGAGLNQLIVLMARVATGEKKMASGKIVPIRGEDVPYGADDTGDILARFLRSKLAPLPSGVLDWIVGENIVGEKTTVSKVVSERVTPMTWRDIWDAEKELNVPQGTVAAIEAFFGEGVTTYGKRTSYRNADEEGKKKLVFSAFENLGTKDNDKAAADLQSFGITLGEARSLLREYYLRTDSSGKRGSLREKDSGDLKESYLKKQRALGRLFGEQ